MLVLRADAEPGSAGGAPVRDEEGRADVLAGGDGVRGVGGVRGHGGEGEFEKF